MKNPRFLILYIRNNKREILSYKGAHYEQKTNGLMILDGYGLNERHDANAVYEANTPVMDKLMAEYPFVKGNASGLAVGLPDGQMGNSEVGHMNMG